MVELGYKIIYRGRVHPAATLEQAAERLLEARAQGATNVRARRCTSLTRDRDLGGAEQQQLLAAACALAAS